MSQHRNREALSHAGVSNLLWASLAGQTGLGQVAVAKDEFRGQGSEVLNLTVRDANGVVCRGTLTFDCAN
jgi:hypothetical protein